MLVDIEKEQIYDRKADHRGRISLPSKKYANKKIQVGIIEQKEKEEQ